MTASPLLVLAAAVLALAALAPDAAAQRVPRHAPSSDFDLPRPAPEAKAPPPFADLDPRGVWFHGWTGSTAGTEWALVLDEGDGTVFLADVLGDGVRFAVDAEGVITGREPGPGDGASGRFITRDHARFDWHKRGMTFSSVIVRVPFVPADTPLVLASPAPGDKTLAGAWRGSVTELSPVTGAVLGRVEVDVEVTVERGTLLLTRPDGSWDRGVFETPTTAVFRVRDPMPQDERFRTTPGAGSSRAEDVVGLARVRGRNLLEVLLLLQTRVEVGEPLQFALRYDLRRVEPLAYGDVDADGRLGDIDRGLIEKALGATEADDAFRIGMDLTGDRRIDEEDLAAWDAADQG